MPTGLNVDAALIPAAMLNKLLTAYYTQCHSASSSTIIGKVIDDLRQAGRGENPIYDAKEVAIAFITERNILETYNPECPDEFFNCNYDIHVLETVPACVSKD